MPANIFPGAAPKLPKQPSYAFDDTDSLRGRIETGVVNSLKTTYPLENEQCKLELTDLGYTGPEHFTFDDQKKALMNRVGLYRKLQGTWKLSDKKTGEVLDQSKQVVAKVPYLTQRGTFIYNGNEYTVANQLRLRPGVYSRAKETGELESHFNVIGGTGRPFRLFMEPSSGIFKIKVGQSMMPLYPILKDIGVTHNELKDAWGEELANKNAAEDNNTTVIKALDKLADARSIRAIGGTVPPKLTQVFDLMRLDPEVTQLTLGKPYDKVNKEVILASTKKMMDILKGKADIDDRDSLVFQKTHTPADLFAERVAKDVGGVGHKLLWRSTLHRQLRGNHSGVLTPQLLGVLLNSGLGQPLEEPNPLDVLDQRTRSTRLGVGGIASADSIPKESSSVQPSQFGFVDCIRTPESQNAGVDTRFALHTKLRANGELVNSFFNPKTKTLEELSPKEVYEKVVGFPEAMTSKEPTAWAMHAGKMVNVPKEQLDAIVPHASEMFSFGSNLVPMLSAIKGGRLLMAGKFANQALSLRQREAPLVQTICSNGKSINAELGKHVGAIFSPAEGKVLEVTPDSIKIQDKQGKIQEAEIYNNFPLNRKSYVHSEAQVKPGDYVTKDQILASSNYTDKKGNLALGVNLKVGYLPYRGQNYEDAIVISQAAADRLASEHMYTHEFEHDDDNRLDKPGVQSLFAKKYTQTQFDKLDKDGVIKPGTVLHQGDPVLVAIRQKQGGGSSPFNKQKAGLSDVSQTWKHHTDGVVTDVFKTKDGVKIAVKTYAPMKEGDKMTNFFGGKGVVGAVVPTESMPRNEAGEPLEVLLNPTGVMGRVNPAQCYEAALGKIAVKTGKPYILAGFQDKDLTAFVSDELKKYGLSETEDLYDPVTNRKLANIFTGVAHMLKLQHTSESKIGNRESGGYTFDQTPAKGGESGAKRLSLMELSSLVAHGATEVLKDSKVIRGQRNDDYWRAFKLGLPVPMPTVPFVYQKFKAMLQASGINLHHNPDGGMQLFAMTDKDVDKLSHGEITHGDTVDFKHNEPIPGGLFDISATGGIAGRNWSHIGLTEPMPNPIMEEPIRRLLGLTKQKFEDILAGQVAIPNCGTGSEGLTRALSLINTDKEITNQREIIKSGRASKRDDAVKNLGYLTGLQKAGLQPKDMILSKFPVLPPSFRPTAQLEGMELVSDPNLLYKEVMNANDVLRNLKPQLPSDQLGEERLTLYKTLKAVTGLGEPVSTKLQDKKVSGMLQHIFGSSPKFGLFQRRCMGSAVDLVGRAAISPNAGLNMDQVGLPESAAWKIYRPFVIRRLVLEGMPSTQAYSAVEKKTPAALNELLKEMAIRPVIINRAPSLHKYSLMSAFPTLHKGDTLQIPPLVTALFNCDYDGDAMQYHVPVSEKARLEAIEKMLPSKNLFSSSNFKVHELPRHEFAQGLYRATHFVDEKKPVKMFATKRDAIQAFLRGELSPFQRVEILEKKTHAGENHS